jgi:hypothetical protein
MVDGRKYETFFKIVAYGVGPIYFRPQPYQSKKIL